MVHKQDINSGRGDKGFTDDACSGRFLKDSLECVVCGGLDELSSFLGLARSVIDSEPSQRIIKRIQSDLLLMGTEVARRGNLSGLKRRLGKQSLNFLKQQLKTIQENRQLIPDSFVLPGKNLTSAALDVARAVSRRVERKMVHLDKESGLNNDYFVVYLNKLSDLLYLMARKFENSRTKKP